MLRVVAPVARIGISGGSARSGAGGAVGGPWISMSAFDGLFGFEVVLELAFLRELNILNPLAWASRDGLTPGWGLFGECCVELHNASSPLDFSREESQHHGG
jgi:hypothetical protein